MDRPNLILITTDQQRWDTIAALGAQGVLTPHLDWLVRTGVSFTDATTDCPICGPARSTIMTGQHAWRHGEVNNRNQPSPMAGLPTLPGLLAESGYQTRATGKMHFHPVRAHYGFQHMEILPDYYRWIRQQPGVPPPKGHGVGENEMSPCLATVPDHLTVTSWTIDRAIDFQHTRDTTRPFFNWISFSKPHPPFDPPFSCWEMIDPDGLPDPLVGDWADESDPDFDAWREPTYSLNSCHRFSFAQMKAAKRAYHACILHIDHQIGRLLAHLRELGRLQDTWILFTSDHGEMLFDHRMGAKSSFFQGSRRVPMILRPPDGSTYESLRGTTDPRLACLADILPTFLGLAGVEPPSSSVVDGLSLVGEGMRERVIGESGGFHAVIEKEWAYHWTERGGVEQLFRRGPDEERSSQLKEAPEERERMRRILEESLASRGHAAAGLIPTRPIRSEAEVSRTPWPGFHSISDESCDLLH